MGAHGRLLGAADHAADGLALRCKLQPSSLQPQLKSSPKHERFIKFRVYLAICDSCMYQLPCIDSRSDDAVIAISGRASECFRNTQTSPLRDVRSAANYNSISFNRIQRFNSRNMAEVVKTTIKLSRSIAKRIESKAQAEGAGARVRRSIGRPELRSLDPFLMLDEFTVAQPAGFPE